jgi:type IV pilus assembly protein PilY1
MNGYFKNTVIGFLLGMPFFAIADDTEIFFADPASVDASAPYVMLSTELRPNTGSSTCSDVESNSCKEKLTFDGDPSAWHAMRCIMDENWFFSAERTDVPGPETIPDNINNPDANDCVPSYSDVDFRELLILSLYLVFIDLDAVNIGFMVPHNDSGNSCNPNSKDCSNGGYILSGFRPFAVSESSWDANGNKSRLLNILKMLPSNQTLTDINANISHSWQAKEMFFEFYRYLTGQEVLNGLEGWEDFDTDDSFNIGDPEQCLYDNLGNPVPLFDGNGVPTAIVLDCFYEESQTVDTGSASLVTIGDDYDSQDVATQGNNVEQIPIIAGPDIEVINSPKSANPTYVPGVDENAFTCSGVYTVNATFAVNQFDDDNDNDIDDSFADGGLELNNPSFEDIVRRLRTMDPADGGLDITLPGNDFVKSYFIVNTSGAANRADPWAVAGGTNAAILVGDNIAEFKDAFTGIFDQINAVTSTFTAVSVPVNVQNRIQALNQLFLAVFVPDDDGHPVWPGNLKKLKVTFDEASSSVSIVDAEGNDAFNPNTGRVDDNALTFWTDPAGRDVDQPLTDPDTGEILIPAGRDGSAVNRGGSGQNIPGYLPGDSTENVGLCNNSNDPACAANSPRQVFIGPETLNASNQRTALEPVDARFILDDTSLQAYDSALWSDIDADSLVTFFGASLTSADADDKKAEATALALKWMRGFDIFDEDADGDTDDVRRWIMGDVLHSRPLTINYGETVSNCGPPDPNDPSPPDVGYDPDTRTCNPDIRVVFGTNDGLLHMVESTEEGANGAESGVETWAYMPRVLLDNVQSWMTSEDFSINRPYGVDGAVTSLTIDNNDNGIIETSRNNATGGCTNGDPDCDKVYIYHGLRRGGKNMYALDISNKDDNPGMLWRIEKGDAGFEDLGLTFSDPRVGFFRFEDVSGLNVFTDDSLTFNVPVGTVVFGGGYWGGPEGGEASPGTAAFDYSSYVGKDNLTTCATVGEHPTDPDDASSCTAVDAEGNALYMVHARTGELVWKVVKGATDTSSPTTVEVADFNDSVAAPVTMVPSRNENGIIELFYVADTGGNVWRFDTPRAGTTEQQEDASFRTDNWQVTKIAELGHDSSDGVDRRFFAAMDIARSEDELGEYLGLVLISGDRAHPRSETSVQNTTFMIKDRFTVPGKPDGDPDNDPATNTRQPITLSDLENVTSNCLTAVDRQADDLCQVDEADTSGLINGWYFDLGGDGEGPGEKGFTQPLIGFDPQTEEPIIFFTTYVPQEDDPEACTANIGFSRLYEVDFATGAPKFHLSGSTTGTDFIREDRFENLAPGIDGGVTAITPNQGLTSTGRPVEIGSQRPIPKYWREKGVDVLDD